MKDRVYQNFEVVDFTIFKTKMLNWMKPFSISCLLDNHLYQQKHTRAEWIAGVSQSTHHSHLLSPQYCFQELQHLHETIPDWYLGHFNFEANQQQPPEHPVAFPVAHFFRPDTIILLKDNQLTIGSIVADPAEIFESIQASAPSAAAAEPAEVEIRCIETKETFIQTIEAIQQHIQRGDCYEMNYCTAFYAENACLDPLALYLAISASNPSPFAAYYRYFDQYLISASPERFLQKKATVLRSQPIKGTIQRAADQQLDDRLQQQLLHSAKDQAENVMIVDLVRNDLSMVCKPGSVKVEEMMALYSFPHVHQLISTVTGELENEKDWGKAIEKCYPMGSMTGAPKKTVLALTEKFEKQPRGLFSGSIGYLQPDSDFDFNVVIRSILYNKQSGYVCFPAGAGITIYSDAEKEWEECELKIANIKKVLAP
ncbi:chorismate-binding protein [Gynurincola endophyticus]|uniref:chorismate-binding protein n=1 Tax=Gynurincola endophyticus TaxID=2479004 RepID=UPI0013152ADC|nr:anthranilate synthase component I family protein [Gynurincola endophyticus]